MSNKQILVTGGTGFIGSHTVVELQQAGYEVVIFDNLVNSKEEVVSAIEKITGTIPTFVQGDLLDKQGMNQLFSEYTFDAVIHFAGLKAVGTSCSQPFTYRENNIIGTINLLHVMDTYKVKNLVFSSSATVYDAQIEQAPFDESMRTGHTTNPYGTTKLVIEHLLEDMVNWKDMSIASLRYFNPIGAHPSGLIGEDPADEPTNLFPVLMEVLEGRRECLYVFGDTYATSDGSGIRDYIHVVDLAKAHVLTLEKICSSPDTNNSYQIYNVGTGTGTSVLEMIKCVEQVLNKKIAYKIIGPRDGDVAISVADVTHINQELGRTSQLSIHDAIDHTWVFRSQYIDEQ